MRQKFNDGRVLDARGLTRRAQVSRTVAAALTVGLAFGFVVAVPALGPEAAWAEQIPETTAEAVPEPVAPELVPEPVIPELVIPEPVIPELVIPEPVIPEAVVPEAAVPDPEPRVQRAPEAASAPGVFGAPLEGVGSNGKVASSSPGPESVMTGPSAAGSRIASDLVAGGVTANAPSARGTLLGDNYPARYRDLPWYYPDHYIAQSLIWDEWNFAYRQCTSFVAWRLNNANGIPFSNQYGGLTRWGDAGQWGDSARSLGINVDTVPEVGAVAWSSPFYVNASGFGHVAWVSQILDDGYIVIEEYNAGWSGSYGVRTVHSSAFQGYIHVHDIPTAFGDVAPGHKFFKEIEWMAETGKSTGVRQPAGQPKYMPSAAVSREAMAAFLYRLQVPAGYVAPEVSPFADMHPGDKFYREITWMFDSGLSTGIKQAKGKPIYAPKASVSREAMAAFIYRLEEASSVTPEVSPFADMQQGDKFYKEIAWMSTEGLSTGIRQPSGLPIYAPKASVSREAMAAFLYRLEGN